MQTPAVNQSSPRSENPGGVNSPSNPTPVARVVAETDSIELPIFERSVLQKDKVTLSDDSQLGVQIDDVVKKDNDTSSDSGQVRADKSPDKESADSERVLTEQQEKEVLALQARDAEVRAHERAHKAVGGQYAGAISYDYQQGPNGKRYAVGGEVSIDASPVSGNPEKTIEKMNVIKAAALAPAEPSSQDRRVAAQASQVIASARAELNAAEQPSGNENKEDASSDLRINKRSLESYSSVSDLRSEDQNATRQLIDDLA